MKLNFVFYLILKNVACSKDAKKLLTEFEGISAKKKNAMNKNSEVRNVETRFYFYYN